MAEAAQRVLMNEFKQLSKEKWTNIEASRPYHDALESHALMTWQPYEHPANRLAACQR